MISAITLLVAVPPAVYFKALVVAPLKSVVSSTVNAPPVFSVRSQLSLKPFWKSSQKYSFALVAGQVCAATGIGVAVGVGVEVDVGVLDSSPPQALRPTTSKPSKAA